MITFPAGDYYIGDLCYVLHDDWDEVCQHDTGKDTTLKNGTRFVLFNTTHGDGSYYDFGKLYEFSVDSGTIGIVSVKDIDFQNNHNNAEWGAIIKFRHPVDCYSDDDGVLTFGHLEIDTNPSCVDD